MVNKDKWIWSAEKEPTKYEKKKSVENAEQRDVNVMMKTEMFIYTQKGVLIG